MRPDQELLYTFADPERMVYHYTRSATVIDHILAKRQLRFCGLAATNDPKESKQWHFDAGTNGVGDLGKYPLAELSARMSAKFKEQTSLVCFSKDRQLTGVHIQEIFQRGFCKPRMWAQYGENHAGICLIFERSKLADAIREAVRPVAGMLIEGSVSYRNRPLLRNLSNREDQAFEVNVDHLEQHGENQYVLDHIATHYKQMFFEKCRDWRDEDEYRWVAVGVPGPFDFDYKDSLRGVVFGASCTCETINKVAMLTAGMGLWYEQLVWKSSRVWYSFNIDLRCLTDNSRLPGGYVRAGDNEAQYAATLPPGVVNVPRQITFDVSLRPRVQPIRKILRVITSRAKSLRQLVYGSGGSATSVDADDASQR